MLLVNNKILLLAPKNKLYFSFIHQGGTGVWRLNYHIIQFYTLAYNSIQKYTIVYKSIRKYTKVYSLLVYTEVYCS